MLNWMPSSSSNCSFEKALNSSKVFPFTSSVNNDADARLISLASKSDVLVHDAQYTPDEVTTTRKGWGHSSYESAVRAAQDAGVNRLVLTSHDPDRADGDVDRLRSAARAMFPNTDAAYEGMTISL